LLTPRRTGRGTTFTYAFANGRAMMRSIALLKLCIRRLKGSHGSKACGMSAAVGSAPSP
jgi:hypothetical protein